MKVHTLRPIEHTPNTYIGSQEAHPNLSRATCQCGWQSRWYVYTASVLTAAQKHLQEHRPRTDRPSADRPSDDGHSEARYYNKEETHSSGTAEGDDES